MEIKCTQCGAGIEIKEDSGFITCPYCDSRLYVETDQTVEHLYIKPRLQAEQLKGALGRELFKKELTQPVEVVSAKLIFIPFWLVRLDNGFLRVPASQLEFSEMKKFKIPVGKLAPYEPELERDYEVRLPEIDLNELLSMPQIKRFLDRIKKISLIHIPFWEISYKYEENIYQALIDAGSSQLFAEELPPSPSKAKDRYFMTWFGVLSGIFLLEAFLLPKFWMIALAYLGTGAISYYFLNKDLAKRGY